MIARAKQTLTGLSLGIAVSLVGVCLGWLL